LFRENRGFSRGAKIKKNEQWSEKKGLLASFQGGPSPRGTAAKKAGRDTGGTQHPHKTGLVRIETFAPYEAKGKPSVGTQRENKKKRRTLKGKKREQGRKDSALLPQKTPARGKRTKEGVKPIGKLKKK